MATQPLVADNELSLRIPVGGGRSEVVDLPRTGIHPALLLANERSMLDAAYYLNLADRLLFGEWWFPKRIYVTSPAAADGKTCTAFNLAWALSTRKATVLLIELNFARPRFTRILGGVQIQYGVDCAIRRRTDPANSVFSVQNQLLSISAVKNVIPKGDLKQDMPHLGPYLNWCGNNYDWLILDCPSVLSPEWNKWFRDYARTALMVVRERHTPVVQVRKATKRLGASLKGVVLNDAVDAGS